MGPDEPELIRRWRSGEAAAFETLVRRWQQPVARFFARLLGQSGAIADLSQEAFLRVYLARDRYREEGRFSTWLYRIALNLARDHIRKQARQPVPLPEEVPAAIDDDRAPWEHREIQEGIDQALAELSPPLREVLVLRHYQGLNFEEMGRLLGTPATTLKSRFGVALRQMHAILQGQGWDEES
jgi:RNA polymerase sigma-70 factor (ECF subfamily)